MSQLSGDRDEPTFPYPWCNAAEMEEILKLSGVILLFIGLFFVWYYS